MSQTAPARSLPTRPSVLKSSIEINCNYAGMADWFNDHFKSIERELKKERVWLNVPLAVNASICRNKVARRDGEKLSRIPNREALSDSKLQIGCKNRRYLNVPLEKTKKNVRWALRVFVISITRSWNPLATRLFFYLREIGRTPRSSDETRLLTPVCVHEWYVLYRIFRK